MSPGTYISFTLHASLVGWLLFGGDFDRKPLELPVTEVSVISSEMFDIMLNNTVPIVDTELELELELELIASELELKTSVELETTPSKIELKSKSETTLELKTPLFSLEDKVTFTASSSPASTEEPRQAFRLHTKSKPNILFSLFIESTDS